MHVASTGNSFERVDLKCLTRCLTDTCITCSDSSNQTPTLNTVSGVRSILTNGSKWPWIATSSDHLKENKLYWIAKIYNKNSILKYLKQEIYFDTFFFDFESHLLLILIKLITCLVYFQAQGLNRIWWKLSQLVPAQFPKFHLHHWEQEHLAILQSCAVFGQLDPGPYIWRSLGATSIEKNPFFSVSGWNFLDPPPYDFQFPIVNFTQNPDVSGLGIPNILVIWTLVNGPFEGIITVKIAQWRINSR